ncbi:hypothetical protein ABGB17_32045 [Sphaerisporangium sp. B11E5]|uniref:hypothetical protein n=1 Tax=Sphaerisporangium sp. B11E5 TaxID=3153563 RepID=UPI00325D545A
MAQIRRRRRLFGSRGPNWHARHAVGQPYIPVEPGNPDPRARATAVLLDRLEPAWTILYGTWSRRFYAMALFAVPYPLTVEATSAQELTELMRQAEQEILSGGTEESSRVNGWHRVSVAVAA